MDVFRSCLEWHLSSVLSFKFLLPLSVVCSAISVLRYLLKMQRCSAAVDATVTRILIRRSRTFSSIRSVTGIICLRYARFCLSL